MRTAVLARRGSATWAQTYRKTPGTTARCRLYPLLMQYAILFSVVTRQSRLAFIPSFETHLLDMKMQCMVYNAPQRSRFLNGALELYVRAAERLEPFSRV